MAQFVNLREFIDVGMLQEVNRQVLHPLGYALSLEVDPDDPSRVTFAGILDARDDPEGYRFDFNSFPEPADAVARFKTHAATVEREWEIRRATREANLGYMVQPVTAEALLPTSPDAS